MKRMFLKNHTIPAILIIMAVLASCGGQKTSDSENQSETFEEEETETPGEWIDLLANQSLEQWRGYLLDSIPGEGWHLDGDTLKLQREEGQPRPGDIITIEQFTNFELTFDFKLFESTNSGVFYQVIEREGDLIFFNAPEYQLMDNFVFLKTTEIEELYKHLSGDCYDLYSCETNLLNPLEEWNTGRIKMQNGEVTYWLNDRQTVNYNINSDDWKTRVANSKFAEYPEFGKANSGHIALQDHGNEVWFKEIKIRVL